MSTAYLYRRALLRFATSIVFTILNIVVCTLMIHWVSQHDVSPLILVLTAPLALTIWNMWQCTVKDLVHVGVAVSFCDAEVSEGVPEHV
jgi:ABC-type proline/glycine betaine transport system permease subunit